MAGKSPRGAPDDLGHHLRTAVATNRPELERVAASPTARGWLKPQLETAEGTHQIYGLMEDVVGGSAFLEHLTEAQHKTRQTGSKPPARGDPEWQVLQQEQWWDTPSSNKAGSTENTQEGPQGAGGEEPLDSYVLVSKDDVLEAMGSFVAAYLAQLPQAQNLQPAELQLAIQHAFKELRKSRTQQLWTWGKAIYRCVSFSYGAFTVYENPWLVRAILTAMWTASRVMLGLLL
jgi:hypothetical protein